MHFDLKLWRMTAGLRGRIALSAVLGLLALAVGIARFAFLGRFLAGVFRGEMLVLPLLGRRRRDPAARPGSTIPAP